MAPLIRLIALFSILASVIASPHFPRNAYNHVHRAIAHPAVRADDSTPPSVPRRQRSLNKRCIPRPSNSTSTPLPSSTPLSSSSTPSTPPTPVNVAPSPSLPPKSSSSSSSSSSPSLPPTPNTPTPPTPTPTSTPTPTPSPTPPSTSGGSSQPSYMVGTQNGQGTWYDTGLGACGITNSNTDLIAAVSQSLFDTYPGFDTANPNTNPVCGKVITVTDPSTNKKVTVTVTDRCVGCQTTDLDMSPTAFQALTGLGTGRMAITWVWGGQ